MSTPAPSPEADRIVRIIVRFGGRPADFAQLLACSKEEAGRYARRMGYRFREPRP